MRIRYALLAALALAAIVLIACGGSDAGDDSDATATLPPPPATDTPELLVDVPGQPNAFEDWPGVVAIYLTVAGPGALGTPCLAELIETWDMPEPDVPLTPEERCLVGNTDTDDDDEVTVLLTTMSEDGSGLLSNIVVFDLTPDGYIPVSQSYTPDQLAEVFPPSIVAAEDITGDGNGDLVYTETTCGAHTCTLAVHVTTGEGGEYTELTPEGGLIMETAVLSLVEGVAEPEKIIVLRGGTIGSAGAGPQRTRTELYGWDGEAFIVLETTFDPTDMLYFHILDADLLFDTGNIAIASQMYRSVLADESLVETGFHENELDELGAYVTFRIALSQLIVGESQAGAFAALDQGLIDYEGTVNVGLIEAFKRGYEATDNVPGGCLAVREHIDANFDAFQAVWEYGYANPPFEPERFCPF